MNRRLLHWIPALAAPALIAAGVGVASIPAQADIPAKTPAQVVALAAGSHVRAFSGAFRQSSQWGLPGDVGETAPGAGASEQGQAALLQTLTASHTGRVYVDGADRQRLQIVSGGNETDIVRRGTTAWVYDSQTQTATRVRGTAREGAPALPGRDATPQQLAHDLLGGLTPTTRVGVLGTTRVAGRDAYRLELQPKARGSLVGAVTVAVDAKTGMALAVSVTARGAHTPAFSLAYTSVDLATPPAARFTFTPPADSRVKQVTLPPAGTPGTDRGEQGGHAGAPTVLGSGWTAIATWPAGAAGIAHDPLFLRLSSAVPGGRLVSTALVNVYVTDSGRVFAGAVDPGLLYAAARRAS